MKNKILTLLVKKDVLFIYSLVYWKIRLVWFLWRSSFLMIFKKTLRLFFNYRAYTLPMLQGTKSKAWQINRFFPRVAPSIYSSPCGITPKFNRYVLDSLVQLQ